MARRKVKKNLIKLFIFFAILVFAGFGALHFFKKDENKPIIPIKEEKPKEEKKDEVYTLKFLATGDGLVHRTVFNAYYKNGKYDFTDALSLVKPIVKNYDIAFYNQEPPMGDNSIKYDGYPRFYIPQEFGDAMQDAGFNTVALATNHSLDVGTKGLLNTLNYFKKTDMLYNGMSETEEERSNYIIKEKNNITYSLLAYTTSTNGIPVPSGKSYLLNTYDKEKVKKDVEALRDKVDVLMVAMHWGIEYVFTPTEEQKEIANYLASLGVDIVIGNHPHVLQPITKIGDTIIMYSLGNFISNQHGTNEYKRLVGFLATLDITKTVHPDGEEEIVFDNLGGELIFTHYDGLALSTTSAAIAGRKNHKVIPFSQMTDDAYLKNYKEIYEKYVDVLKNMGTDLNITPVGG